MLIDDDADDNFFHSRVIAKCDAAETIVVRTSGRSALEYLRSKHDLGEPLPDLIFLDVNMPGMTGWEFLEVYERLNAKPASSVIVVMLTTSENPDDRAKAIAMNVEFSSKPLTRETLEEVLGRHQLG